MPDSESHVAIVAIHGVADQAAGSSARAAADLLLRDSGADYSSFEECGLRIPVERMPLHRRCEVTPRGMIDQQSELLRALEEKRALRLRPGVPGAGEVSGIASDRPDAVGLEIDRRAFNRRLDELSGASRQAALADFRVEEVRPVSTPRDPWDEWESHEIMREQLQDYAPDAADSVYETLRLHARRRPEAQGGEQAGHRVDVYEMHWADLSRLGDRLVGIVLSFYQLLFLLVRLGGLTLGRAHARYGKAGERWRRAAWWLFSRAHAVAELLLVVGVPILNLCLLGLASALLVPLLEYYQPEWSSAIYAGWRPAVLLLVVPVVAFKTREDLQPPSSWPRVWWFLLAVAAATGASGLVWKGSPAAATWVAALLAAGFCAWMHVRGILRRPARWLNRDLHRSRSLWTLGGLGVTIVVAGSVGLGFGSVGLEFFCWLLAAGLLFAILVPWNRRRSGALSAGATLLGVTTVLWLIAAALAPAYQGHYEPVAIAREVADWISNSDVFEGALRWGVPGLLTSVWLAFFAFTGVTTYAGLVATWRTRPQGRARRAAWTANLTLTLSGLVVLVVNLTLWKALAILGGKVPGLKDYVSHIDQLVNRATLEFFWIIVSLTALSVFFSVWLILPAGLSELEKGARTALSSIWLGEALEVAFRKLRTPGETIRWLLVLGIPAVLLYALLRGSPGASSLDIALVVALGGVAVVILTGKGPLRFLGLGFRAVLDILLDVANWLRLDPATRTPRARICARYLALLRHLAEWRDPVDGRGYERIVILAHSQGTVITADLFRFLRCENFLLQDPVIERLLGSPVPGNRDLPIRLFTMGCPLRQLYSRRFPFYYGWAQSPDPSSLGVECWLNAYCSGDYVGRDLWSTGPARWIPSPEPTDVRAWAEYCIGAGGHTHYWDGSAPSVARALDVLATR